MGSVVLCLFSVSITLLTISCQKQASAQSTNGTSSKVIVFFKWKYGTQLNELWIANTDGTGVQQVSIPSTLKTTYVSPSLINNKIVFMASSTTPSNNDAQLYSCDVDGSNLQKITNEANLWLAF